MRKRNMTMKFIFFSWLICLLQMNTSLAASDNASVLVIRGDAKEFIEVVQGLTEDLSGDIDFSELVVTDENSANGIYREIRSSNYSAVVLVGNGPANLYAELQEARGSQNLPPAIIMAALYADRLAAKMNNIIGVRYEIPAVIGILNLRKLLRTDVRKVGVIHRRWMTDFVRENARYCNDEGVELVSYILENDERNFPRQIKRGLKSLRKRDVDAIWVINDNVLLTSETLFKGWIPGLSSMDVPVMVGVDTLVASRLKFGSYSVVPDLYALGIQGATIMEDLMDNNWTITRDRRIEQPFSIEDTLNVNIFESKEIPYRLDVLGEVDSIVK